MAETDITWTHRPGTTGRTWNFTRGCWPVSSGCLNCYAARQGGRFCGPGKPYHGLVQLGGKRGPQWTGEGLFVVEKLLEPLSWRGKSTVFVDSMSDLFFDAFAFEQIAAAFVIMALTPESTYQILTKRPERALEFHVWMRENPYKRCNDAFTRTIRPLKTDEEWVRLGITDFEYPVFGPTTPQEWPLPNVWQGISAENQACYDERLPYLIEIPAAVKFLSLEPLLGEIQLDLPMCDQCGGTEIATNGVDGTPFCAECGGDDAPEMSYGHWNQSGTLEDGVAWVIVGAESGPRARECQTEWIRSIVRQCADASVALFLKQAVETSASSQGGRFHYVGVGVGAGSKRKGRGFGGPIVVNPYLDGFQYIEFPKVEEEQNEDAA